VRMLFESRQRRLEVRYRARLTAAGAAHAAEPALAGGPSATACAIERANAYRKQLEIRMRAAVGPSAVEPSEPSEPVEETATARSAAVAALKALADLESRPPCVRRCER